jgi:hypothetical protein
LKEGEEHGLNEYRDLLKSSDISPEQKQHVRDVFIPNQERHIKSIGAMIKMQ